MKNLSSSTLYTIVKFIIVIILFIFKLTEEVTLTLGDEALVILVHRD